MAVFRVERNRGYTVMSNHHLRNQIRIYQIPIAVNPVFREEVQRPRRLLEIVDFRPMLIAPAFLRLDAVLNVNNKGDTAALLLRGFGGAGAPALDTLRYGFLCIIRAERFQTGKAFLPRCAARYVFTRLYLIARSLQQPQKIGKV